RRGFSLDELAYVVLRYGWATTILHTKHVVYSSGMQAPKFYDIDLAKDYFEVAPLDCYVLCTDTHAFGYKNGTILDRTGVIKYMPDWSQLTTVCVLHKLR